MIRKVRSAHYVIILSHFSCEPFAQRIYAVGIVLLLAVVYSSWYGLKDGFITCCVKYSLSSSRISLLRIGQADIRVFSSLLNMYLFAI